MKALLNRLLPFLVIVSVVALPACEGQQADAPDADTTGMDGVGAFNNDAQETATAVLEPTEGNNVSGTVTFMQMDNGVHVIANLTGLSEGAHGFHVHETGDCSASDATSAGGHFNPDGSPHGAPTDPEGQRHMGDLGNVEAGADGAANYERVDELLAMSGPNSIVGKAVIVHSDPDDLESQPTGEAGDRLACGVIRLDGGAGMMQQDTTANF